MLAVSVVLCTRNRADLLRRILLQLQVQGARAAFGWELLVVDNGSTDTTRDVLARADGMLPLRALFLAQPGQTRARNEGVRQSRGGLVVFLDDDVRLGDDWLGAWARVAEEQRAAMWFGGRVLTDWPQGRPAWVRDPDMDLIDGVLVRHNLGDTPCGYSIKGPLPVGANCAVRREAMDQVGLFREDLGHQGDLRAIGDETEWFERARSHGLPGAYVPDAVAWHPAVPERLTMRGLLEHGRATARGWLGRHGRALAMSPRSMTWWLARGAWQLVRGRGDRFRQCVICAGMDEVFRNAVRGAPSRVAGGTDSRTGDADTP